MANADTPNDALIARMNGAQGIGLCRSEHMAWISYPELTEMQIQWWDGSAGDMVPDLAVVEW
ncbi:Pyruvate, phosphate dikinase, chloroplastic [Artemisia annua]|uniref:Pyruvate, phosphate dikinase, chloroplastic n=1 Tax=Artemisia annua TaxID=35608 RepID=A0A2U1M2H4_ARTAN|nr:Pyruvate, phosphate dikinase, chloroplastic [Artemisia annua]